jgi:hypothetical protein
MQCWACSAPNNQKSSYYWYHLLGEHNYFSHSPNHPKRNDLGPGLNPVQIIGPSLHHFLTFRHEHTHYCHKIPVIRARVAPITLFFFLASSEVVNPLTEAIMSFVDLHNGKAELVR